MKKYLFPLLVILASLFAEGQPKKADLIRLLGKFPIPPKLKIDTLEKVNLANGIRYKIKFLSEDTILILYSPKDFIEAYLFIPNHKPHEKLPAMIAIHQDGEHKYLGKKEPAGLAGDGDQQYGLELFNRGYVVICPDRFYHSNRRRISNPDTLADVWEDEGLMMQEHWGGQLLSTGRTVYGKEVYDLMRSMDVLYKFEFIDKNKIGAIGHSAGGNTIAYFMFMDKRVKLGASSCGIFEMANWFDEKGPSKRPTFNAVPNFINYARTSDYLGFIAPRPLLMTRGLWEWGTDSVWAENSKRHVIETKQLEKESRVYYKKANANQNLKMIYFDENGGNHAFPPATKELVFKWIDSYLKRR